MPDLITPGVYIDEKNAFPDGTVAVPSAVPAFIGYTEFAERDGKPLTNLPQRIASLAEYEQYFGAAPLVKFEFAVEKPDGPDVVPVAELNGQDRYLVPKGGKQNFILYRSLQWFFQNGGGVCYIVSVGDYSQTPDAGTLQAGIDVLESELEPTIVLVPDAVLLEDADACAAVQNHCLEHCGKMQSRVTILDVYNGYRPRVDDDCVTLFRSKLTDNNRNYAAAYYPWLHTSIVQDGELDLDSFDADSIVTLQEILTDELDGFNLPADRKEALAALIGKANGKHWSDEEAQDPSAARTLLQQGLAAVSPRYIDLLNHMRDSLNLLPPAAAMAGVYVMVDSLRGVWEAPANVTVAGVVKPAVAISHEDQEDLNVHMSGLSVNAIRSFPGMGVLVWGARTLDGNSLDWRYINVRRLLIMLEQSVKNATQSFVFEPNDANTWVSMKSMVRKFLTEVWNSGGLAGATPEDAFSVHVGLGETMTPEDILEGILRMTVLVAPTRPAEFIEITLQQKMQESK